MKANHNAGAYFAFKFTSIYNIQKNNNWKQITTYGLIEYGASSVFTIFKRTIIESKSQLKQLPSANSSKYLQYSKEQ